MGHISLLIRRIWSAYHLRRLLVQLWGRTSDTIIKRQLHLSHTCVAGALLVRHCLILLCSELPKFSTVSCVREYDPFFGAGTRFWLLVSDDHTTPDRGVPASHS
jgi:hypothetical protein